ncbi:MAG: uncharacterized protein A8A55_1077 [Amphiamblys sp. WSBS2006]|nr:MAG: uncharacterized protein A8A55_1077 [Amphiamblys sp. WSBS2006]
MKELKKHLRKTHAIKTLIRRKGLFLTRAISSVFLFTVILVDIFFQTNSVSRWIFHLTNIALVMSFLYYTLLVLWFTSKFCDERARSKKIETFFKCLYIQVFSAELFVSVIYWLFLYREHRRKCSFSKLKHFVNISSHSQCFLCFFEFLQNTMEIRFVHAFWSGLVFIVTFCLWFMFGAYINRHESGELWSPYKRDAKTAEFHFLVELPSNALIYGLFVFFSYMLHKKKTKYLIKKAYRKREDQAAPHPAEQKQ